MWLDGYDGRRTERYGMFDRADAGIPDRSVCIPCGLDFYGICDEPDAADAVSVLYCVLDDYVYGACGLLCGDSEKAGAAGEKRYLKKRKSFVRQ